MQKQKSKEETNEKTKSSQNTEMKNYTPKPRKLSTRFLNVLKSKSASRDYIVGNLLVMSVMTVFSVVYFSIISQPTSLITASTIAFIASGAFVGSCASSFLNGITGKFKDDFDGFSSGLFQVSLLWLSLLPIGITSGASAMGTVSVLLLATLILPFTSIVYSAMGREITSD